MIWVELFFAAGLITIGGIFIDAIILGASSGPIKDVEGFEFVNPAWWYHNYKVNIFGAIVCALGFTVLNPFITLGYWFYKLCTVGRK